MCFGCVVLCTLVVCAFKKMICSAFFWSLFPFFGFFGTKFVYLLCNVNESISMNLAVFLMIYPFVSIYLCFFSFFWNLFSLNNRNGTLQIVESVCKWWIAVLLMLSYEHTCFHAKNGFESKWKGAICHAFSALMCRTFHFIITDIETIVTRIFVHPDAFFRINKCSKYHNVDWITLKRQIFSTFQRNFNLLSYQSNLIKMQIDDNILNINQLLEVRRNLLLWNVPIIIVDHAKYH